MTPELISSVTRSGDFLTLGNFLKPLAAINLPKSPTFLGNFCKVVKIFHFSSEIILGQLLWTFGDFFLVTLLEANNQNSLVLKCAQDIGSRFKSWRKELFDTYVVT